MFKASLEFYTDSGTITEKKEIRYHIAANENRSVIEFFIGENCSLIVPYSDMFGEK